MTTMASQRQRLMLSELSPEAILDLVESALGIRCTNLCRPYNSYINQVYELADSEGRGLVVKLYRPDRWSQAALQDEHDFLCELAADEIPVIAPLPLRNGGTLGEHDGVYFAVFPKKGGRNPDEFTEEQWIALGRLLGRVHLVGARQPALKRPLMHPGITTKAHLQYIFASAHLPVECAETYQQISSAIIDEILPLFAGIESIRIHGDCHRGNLIYRPGESLHLIDLDDMVMGPPVQDLWMLLPGRVADCPREMELILEGYETFRPFDRSNLLLVEALRAMRFIHYSAWCAMQVSGDGVSRIIPDFGSPRYWQAETEDLADQLKHIRERATVSDWPF
ncbi:serine/threonine protein kinase [Desulfobulbus alkaliphilus]|uniref:serine/threonine protein kinase n=1 Tax=Desulfobulbus alkaliphilus TaxID=869814 RepID=UPI001965C6BD|nr:serine/threonine protein kinase [Desulfobulbus alkaliphilus]MBM9538087.1 serine/threonine protein kinase [Desulfobulbus alkaliphilus]